MTSTNAPDFVLVHGAFSDASLWAGIVPQLEAAGAKVTTFDLPGHTAATNGAAGATTLAQYVEATHAVLAAAPHPVILAGHSLAGMVIAQTAEDLPEKIAALVFVCAFLPASGRTATSYAETDTASLFGALLEADPAAGVGRMTAESLKQAVFSETAPDVASTAAAAGAKIAEPLQPFGTPVTLTPERFGRLERYYVMIEKDHAVTPTLQQEMLDATPVERVFTMKADHAPMLSTPEELVEALLAVRTHLAGVASAARG